MSEIASKFPHFETDLLEHHLGQGHVAVADIRAWICSDPIARDIIIDWRRRTILTGKMYEELKKFFEDGPAPGRPAIPRFDRILRGLEIAAAAAMDARQEGASAFAWTGTCGFLLADRSLYKEAGRPDVFPHCSWPLRVAINIRLLFTAAYDMEAYATGFFNTIFSTPAIDANLARISDRAASDKRYISLLRKLPGEPIEVRFFYYRDTHDVVNLLRPSAVDLIQRMANVDDNTSGMSPEPISSRGLPIQSGQASAAALQAGRLLANTRKNRRATITVWEEYPELPESAEVITFQRKLQTAMQANAAKYQPQRAPLNFPPLAMPPSHSPPLPARTQQVSRRHTHEVSRPVPRTTQVVREPNRRRSTRLIDQAPANYADSDAVEPYSSPPPGPVAAAGRAAGRRLHGAWTDAEEACCIASMRTAITTSDMLGRESRWEECRRLMQAGGVTKTAVAIKMRWQRALRDRSGIEDRRVGTGGRYVRLGERPGNGRRGRGSARIQKAIDRDHLEDEDDVEIMDETEMGVQDNDQDGEMDRAEDEDVKSDHDVKEDESKKVQEYGQTLHREANYQADMQALPRSQKECLVM